MNEMLSNMRWHFKEIYERKAVDKSRAWHYINVGATRASSTYFFPRKLIVRLLRVEVIFIAQPNRAMNNK